MKKHKKDKDCEEITASPTEEWRKNQQREEFEGFLAREREAAICNGFVNADGELVELNFS